MDNIAQCIEITWIAKNSLTMAIYMCICVYICSSEPVFQCFRHVSMLSICPLEQTFVNPLEVFPCFAGQRYFFLRGMGNTLSAERCWCAPDSLGLRSAEKQQHWQGCHKSCHISWQFSLFNTSSSFLEYLNNLYSCRMCIPWPCIGSHFNSHNRALAREVFSNTVKARSPNIVIQTSRVPKCSQPWLCQWHY